MTEVTLHQRDHGVIESPKLIAGDCLDVIPTLPAHHFSVAVADPPYIIGGTSVGNIRSKSGTWADMVNAASWYREWMDLVSSRLRPDGWLLVFGNWRSLPTYICAASRSSILRAQSCMVWDKLWIGPSGTAQLRPRWELVLWLAMPDAKVVDRSVPDIISCKWQTAKSGLSGHPAEKPVALIRDLLRIANPCGGAVLDPFAGRASAGLAALDLGMDYLGIEVDADHCAAGQSAIDHHMPQRRLNL